jgi:predicted PhzF superfamily epimerase YddE/YHI9
VNGASHTVLVVYWSKKLGIDIVRAFQASEREGELWLELAKEPNKSKRMYMRGYAKTVLKGVLFLE